MDELNLLTESNLAEQSKETLSIIVPEKGSLPIISRTASKPVGADELRIMMVIMGYCGRDKSIVAGQKTASVGRIGHEGAGIIVEKGSNVNVPDLMIGKNIIIFPNIDGHNIGYDWPDGGKGIFANFAIIPKDAAYPLDRQSMLVEEWLALSFVEPFSCVLRALKRAKIQDKDSIFILGAGAVGCEQAILAKHLNPDVQIILVDILEKKIAKAKEKLVPADTFLVLRDVEQLKYSLNTITDGNGSSLIINSNPFKESLKQAIKIAPDQGTVLLFSGIPDWQNADNEDIGRGVVIDPRAIHYEEYDDNNPFRVNVESKEVFLIGSRGYAQEDFESSVELIVSGIIDPLPIATTILKFDEDILTQLKKEGDKESNIKILMSPHDAIIRQKI